VESRRTHAESGRAAVPGTDRCLTARRARGAVAGIACAVLGLLLIPAGCLNPRPEEDPSFGSPDSLPEAPPAQSCESNPALASCPRTPANVTDENNGADDADQEASPGAASGAPSAPPPIEDAGADAASPDAASPDAGAPGVAP
jgi:hypothetical protein